MLYVELCKPSMINSYLHIVIPRCIQTRQNILITALWIHVICRTLQAEYDQLLLTHRDPTVHPDPSKHSNNSGSDASDGHDAELLAEAKQLAKHKTQLEVRLRILEDHNRQLEAQIQRLRVLLDQVSANSMCNTVFWRTLTIYKMSTIYTTQHFLVKRFKINTILLLLCSWFMCWLMSAWISIIKVAIYVCMRQ